VSPAEIATVMLMSLGGLLFLAGTIGLLRFPDAYTRLHALTKADNLGLGLIAAGLALQSQSLAVAAKLAGIWLLAIVASATSCYLIAGSRQRGEASPGSDAGGH
jgi:multicomponent Na+:H+ antiporter subunit G